MARLAGAVGVRSAGGPDHPLETVLRRLVHVVPTEAGRALYRQVLPAIAEIHARLRASVTDAEWDQMERILGKIAAGLTAPRAQAGE